MEITVTQAQGLVPVSVVTPHGALDASSYQGLIQKAQDLYAAGARYLLLDLSETTFMSSAGVVALHTIALLLRGEELPDPESGWEAYKNIDRDRDTGKQKYLKILNPTANVDKILGMTGFKNLLEVHNNLEEAVASFDL
jgi:hypothetical protein